MKLELLVGVGSLLASIVAAELLLQLVHKFTPQPRAYVGQESNVPHEYLVEDPDLGWRMAPGREFVHQTGEYRVTYRANAAGFRDGGEPAQEPASRVVALVGDSLSFGWGVEFDETFGALLEASLPATAVHNFALPGYGIDQMWLAERKHVLPEKPALAIVAFISDDFTRSLTAYRYSMGLNKPAFALENGALRRLTPADAPAPWRWYAANHSRLWVGVREIERLVGHHYPVGDWWQLNRALLDAIREDSRASGTPVLFVFLVLHEQRAFPALSAYMQETSADFLDLGNRELSPARPLNYPVDRHLTPDGHRYVADEILAWIGRERPELLASPR